jgi:formate hydrogenlyase subunit 4
MSSDKVAASSAPPAGRNVLMLALIYVFAIWCVATVLCVIVSNFEPNRRLAMVLQFLILAVCAAAIASRLTP